MSWLCFKSFPLAHYSVSFCQQRVSLTLGTAGSIPLAHSLVGNCTIATENLLVVLASSAITGLQQTSDLQVVQGAAPPPSDKPGGKAGRPERRVKITRLRARVAERLKGAQNTYAMLTTFNEIDMTNIMQLRKDFKVCWGT